MAIIYLAKNLLNHKVYVGYSKNTLEHRKAQHQRDSAKIDTLFYRAIRRYGISNFVFSIIEESEDRKYLLTIAEPKWIQFYQSNLRAVGYNMTAGGEGLRGVIAWNRGIPRTEAVKLKLRITHTGRVQSLETIAKRVSKIKGLKRSTDTKRKMASTWKITFPNGDSSEIVNLSEFCREHSLVLPNMIGVANGSRRHHKGFICERLSIGPQSRFQSTPYHLGTNLREGGSVRDSET